MGKVTKLIPRPVVKGTLRLATNVLIRFYSFKFKDLSIRKGTSDHYVFRDIFLFGEFRLPVDIQPKLIIDAGAYIGLSALYYSNKYPSAKIIAIEPEDTNFEMLTRNTESNPNIQRVNAGVWSSNANLRISNKSSEKWAFTVEEVPDGQPFDIRAVTIDSVLENSGFDTIDVLKIDIEGSEKEIFSKNAEKWLPRVNVLVLELHDRMVEGCSDALYSAINKDDWKEFREGEKVILVRKELVK